MKRLLPFLLVLALLLPMMPTAFAAATVTVSSSGAMIPAGRDGELVIKVETDTAITNVKVTLSGGAFTLTSSAVQSVADIPAGQFRELRYSLTAGADMSGYYPVGYTVQYTDSDGSQKELQPDFTEIYVVPQTSTTGKSNLVVESISVNKTSIVPGEEVTFTVTVLSKTPTALNNFKLEVKPEDGLLNKTNTVITQDKFDGNIRKSFTFKFYPKADAVSKFYGITATSSYDGGGEVIRPESTMTSGIFVEAGTTVVDTDKVTIDSVALSKTQAGPLEAFTATVKITNNGSAPIYGLQTTVQPEEGIINKTQNIVLSGKVNPGETKTVEYTLFPKGDAATKNYSIGFAVEYYGKSGDDSTKRTLTQYAGVFVQGKKDDETDGSKTVPKIIISKYVITPQIVQAGTQFDLSMEFMNTSSVKSVHNIKIFLTTDETVEKKGSVFTPVGSSNTFYVDSIGTKGSVSRDITLYTIPDATQKTYTLNVKFQYEDADGNTYEAVEMVGVPVVQQAKMQTSELSMATDGYVGQQNYMSVQFYNTGKETMNNLIIRTEGEGFESQTPTYFVGNFEPGSQDYYENAITPMTTGAIEGKLIFEYEDAAGEQQQFVKEFSMNVMEMPMEDPNGGGEMPMPEEPQQGLGIWLYVIIGAGVLLIGGAVTFIVIRRKKKRQASILDEEAS